MAKLTKHMRHILERAVHIGGTIHVFPEDREAVTVLEARGLMKGNGWIIEREATITDAGRAALAQEKE